MASRGINKVILVGNLGNDPETKSTSSGTTVCNFRVATGEAWKDQQGVLQERTEWHRIVVWGKLAEICGEYLRKGAKVYIEGSLRTSSYEKNGEKRYSTDIVANEMQMLDSKRDDSGFQPAPGQKQREDAAPRQSGTTGKTVDFDDSDIPF